MATRIETQLRREKLRNFLRDAAVQGTFGDGQLVPPVRELAKRFELSVPVALEVVKSLAEVGVLTIVPSVGTFVGRPTASQPDIYIFINVYQAQGQMIDALLTGFEDRVSELGGASLVLDEESAEAYFAEGVHPNVAGVYRTRSAQSPSTWETPDVRQVEFGRVSSNKPRTDMVYFDNEDGGAQATRHLLQLGHTNIAFLGLHGETGELGDFLWSKEREAGWRAAMVASGQQVESLGFQPPQSLGYNREAQIESGRQTALGIIMRADISGVVVANSFAARGLYEALRNARIAEENWPAVVTFDNYQILDGFPATSLRLPWEEIGRTGAELLWKRRHNQISGPAQQCLVSMRLISRLSSRPDWARTLGLGAGAKASTST